jgi:hypothetical protein
MTDFKFRDFARVALLVTGLTALAAPDLQAGVIAGPSAFSVVGGSDSLWGIQFTALDNSTLTGFDYNHRNPVPFGNPLTGTISVNDLTTSSTVYTYNYGTNAAQDLAFSGLIVSLTAGHDYQLVATSTVLYGGNDEVYEYITPFGTAPAYPTADSDIRVTQGVFNNSPGFQENYAWGAFTNITTMSAVPEPATSFGAGMAALMGGALAWRNRRRTASRATTV